MKLKQEQLVAASDRDGVMFSLSAGNCGDAPKGRALLRKLGPAEHPVRLLMDRAYEWLMPLYEHRPA